MTQAGLSVRARNALRHLWSYRFVRDVFALQSGAVVSMISGLVLSIVYARSLGLSEFGRYGAIMAFAGTVSTLINLGQQHTAVTFLAEARAKNDRRQWQDVTLYFFVMAALSALALGVCAWLAPEISRLFYGQAMYGYAARIVFLAAIIDALYLYVIVVLQVLRQTRALSLLDAGKEVGLLTWNSLILWQHPVAEAAVWAFLINAALFAGISAILLRRLLRTGVIPPLFGPKARLSAVWEYGVQGFWMAASKNIANLYPNGLFFVASLYLGTSVLGLVRLAFRLAGLPMTYLFAHIARMSASVTPELIANGHESCLRSLRKLLLGTSGLYVATTIGSIAGWAVLIPWLYGREYWPAIYPAAVIMVAQTPQILGVVYGALLRVTKQTHVMAGINAACILLALSIASLGHLVSKPVWAVYGAVLAYNCLMLFLLLPVVRKALERLRQPSVA